MLSKSMGQSDIEGYHVIPPLQTHTHTKDWFVKVRQTQVTFTKKNRLAVSNMESTLRLL